MWVDYLSKVSPEWKQKVGVNSSVNWPVGVGGKGNEGVAGLVRQTPGSLGYVELVYALQNKISYGAVQNQSGEFVVPDMASVTAAAAGAPPTMPKDFRVSITNAPGAGAYPDLVVHLDSVVRRSEGQESGEDHGRLHEVGAHRRTGAWRPIWVRAAARNCVTIEARAVEPD